MDLTRGRTLAATLILALACGCGSGAVSGGSPDEPGANAPQNNNANKSGGGGGDGGAGGGGGGGEDTDYGPLELPVGNTGVNASSGLVYDALQTGNCAEARVQLAKAPGSVAPPGPMSMQLLRVGIALCERRGADAKSAFAGLSKPTQPQFMCFLYRAAASLIKREPVSAFGDCPTDPGPGGSSPDVETPTPEPSPPESPSEVPSETPSVEATG